MKKAKEYYEEIKPIVLTMDQEKVDNGIFDLLKSLMTEIGELKRVRNVRTDSGMLAIIEELNNKWNAIGNKFIKDGLELLVKDGFKKYMYKELDIVKYS